MLWSLNLVSNLWQSQTSEIATAGEGCAGSVNHTPNLETFEKMNLNLSSNTIPQTS